IDHVTSVGVVTLVHENAYFEVDRVSLSRLAPPQPCERTPERYLERRPWRVSVGHRQPVGNFRDHSEEAIAAAGGGALDRLVKGFLDRWAPHMCTDLFDFQRPHPRLTVR